jgi:phosphopantetheinyl transferase
MVTGEALLTEVAIADLPEEISARAIDVGAVQARHAACLSEEEARRAQAFGSRKRSRQFVAGRVVARHLLAEVLGTSPESPQLVVASDGAIDVRDQGAGLSISIAHSGSMAVAAVRPGSIGIDVEVVRPRRPDLHRFMLSEDEYPLLDALPCDRTEAVILCWSIKESVLKARRSGLRLSPSELDLSIDYAAGSALVGSPEGIWMARFARSGEYVVSTAWMGRRID